MNLFQAVSVPFCAVVAAGCLLAAARGWLSRRQGLAWTLVWGGAAIAIAAPNSTSIVARWLGIGRGADLVFYLAILAGLAGAVYFYTRYRRLEILVTELARRQALAGARQGAGLPDANTTQDGQS